MSAVNNVVLIGNLVDDPELRYTQSGIPMAKIRFAVNRSYKQNDEWVEETSFFGGTCWRDLAEHVADSLHKGDRVIVGGRLEQRTWENDEGEKRSMVEVQIEDIGPSLKFATTSVNRVGREDRGGRQEKVATSSSPFKKPEARQDYGPDEAPF